MSAPHITAETVDQALDAAFKAICGANWRVEGPRPWSSRPLPPAALRMRECAWRGLTQAETARELGISRQAVNQAAGAYGLRFETKVTRLKRKAQA